MKGTLRGRHLSERLRLAARGVGSRSGRAETKAGTSLRVVRTHKTSGVVARRIRPVSHLRSTYKHADQYYAPSHKRLDRGIC